MACTCWDLLGIVERYAELDEKVGMTEMTEAGGGLAATAMAAVAKLGGRAAVLGNVGDDRAGRNIVEALQDVGMDTSRVQVVPGGTSRFAICIIHKATGKRSIFFQAGTMGEPSPEEVDPESVRSAKAILIDSTAGQAGLRCAEIAREYGKPVVLDLERHSPGHEALIRLATHPIFPAHYGEALPDVETPLDLCRAVQRIGSRTVIVTLGDQGCLAVEGETVHRVPAFHVPVVDTTGAGDVFHGAFAYGLALGKPLEENLRFASAVAAISCRALGGRAGLATMDEVDDLLRRGSTRPLSSS